MNSTLTDLLTLAAAFAAATASPRRSAQRTSAPR